MTLPAFDHVRPATLTEAASTVEAGGIPYCGGTELLAAMRMGLLRPERIVSLRRVDELAGVAIDGDVLRIGATTTHQAVAESQDVRSASPLLARIAERIGNIRVRSTGTVGGNLAFAEPRSDLSTVLIALEARAIVGDGSARRSLTVEDFILGPYETSLRSDELLLHIEVPVEAADVTSYRKVTITERPVVGVAVVHLPHRDTWRLAVGAVGDEILVVDVRDLSDFDAAGIAGDVDVLPDLGGSESYKRHLTQLTIECCRDDALAQMREGLT